MTETIRGPQLPAYEVDTLGWVAQRLRVTNLSDGPVTAEVLTGQSAILLRFPSGGERYLYLDEEPHPQGVPVSFIEAESIRQQLEEAEERADTADDVIRSARALLEEIADGDAATELPDWLREQANDFLNKHGAP